jgi:hypothetical protein
VDILHAHLAQRGGGGLSRVADVIGVVGQGADAGDAEELEEFLDGLPQVI